MSGADLCLTRYYAAVDRKDFQAAAAMLHPALTFAVHLPGCEPCAGTVRLRVLRGRRTLAVRRVALRPDCTVRVRFRVDRAHRLRVRASLRTRSPGEGT